MDGPSKFIEWSIPADLPYQPNSVDIAAPSPDNDLSNESFVVDERTTLRGVIAKLEVENLHLRTKLEEVYPPLTLPPPDLPLEHHNGQDLFVDPLIAMELVELRKRLHVAEENVQLLKENAAVASFTSEGPLGRRLLDKCRKLMAENEQLGAALISSRIATVDTAATFHAERERFLMNQIRALYDYNREMEAQCAHLLKQMNKMEHGLQELSVENDALKVQLTDIQRRHERDRSGARMPAPRRGGRSPSPGPSRRRERSPSFDGRDERRRRGGR